MENKKIKLEKEIDFLSKELTKKRDELDNLELKMMSTKPFEFKHIEFETQPFHAIVSQKHKLIINIQRNSSWESKLITKTNEESGETCERYHTIIESDCEKQLGYKYGHQLLIDTGDEEEMSTKDYIMLETDKPLVKESMSYGRIAHDLIFKKKGDEGYDEIVQKPKIYFVGVQTQKNCAWRYYKSPDFTFYKYCRDIYPLD